MYNNLLTIQASVWRKNMLLGQILLCGHYDIGNNYENELKLIFKSFHHSYIA